MLPCRKVWHNPSTTWSLVIPWTAPDSQCSSEDKNSTNKIQYFINFKMNSSPHIHHKSNLQEALYIDQFLDLFIWNSVCEPTRTHTMTQPWAFSKSLCLSLRGASRAPESSNFVLFTFKSLRTYPCDIKVLHNHLGTWSELSPVGAWLFFWIFWGNLSWLCALVCLFV